MEGSRQRVGFILCGETCIAEFPSHGRHAKTHSSHHIEIAEKAAQKVKKAAEFAAEKAKKLAKDGLEKAKKAKNVVAEKAKKGASFAAEKAKKGKALARKAADAVAEKAKKGAALAKKGLDKAGELAKKGLDKMGDLAKQGLNKVKAFGSGLHNAFSKKCGHLGCWCKTPQGRCAKGKGDSSLLEKTILQQRADIEEELRRRGFLGDIGKGLGDLANKAKKGLQKAGKGLGDLAKKGADAAKHAAEAAKKGIEDAMKPKCVEECDAGFQCHYSGAGASHGVCLIGQCVDGCKDDMKCEEKADHGICKGEAHQMYSQLTIKLPDGIKSGKDLGKSTTFRKAYKRAMGRAFKVNPDLISIDSFELPSDANKTSEEDSFLEERRERPAADKQSFV